MASSLVEKSNCITCGKAAGVFTCRGCVKDFCTRHAIEHRQLLNQQMEEITTSHDQLRQNLDEQAQQPCQHPLIHEIDEWEKDSIEKIHKVADDTRKQLLDITRKHTNKLTESLRDLSNRLNAARTDEDFVETDLKEWIEKLKNLNDDLILPQTINIQQDVNESPLVRMILINMMSDDYLEQTAGDVYIEDSGLVMVHGQSTGHAAVRGKHQYSSGKQQFRFNIDRIDANKWVFFGIKSENAPLVPDSANTGTAYGWAGGNAVLLNGVVNSNYNGYNSDMNTNDIVELIIDCEKKKLCLTNERTQTTYELDVDVTKCSFPWQLNLGLYYPSNRIRLIKST